MIIGTFVSTWGLFGRKGNFAWAPEFIEREKLDTEIGQYKHQEWSGSSNSFSKFFSSARLLHDETRPVWDLWMGGSGSSGCRRIGNEITP